MKCLSSVLKFQGNFEIIIVNDGSIDNSIEVIEKYLAAVESSNVRIYSTENFGSAHARNLAIEKATGEFLLFLDSDDQIEHETLQKILSNDLLESKFDAERFSYKTRLGPVIESIGAIDPEDLLQQRGFWRYVYRRQFLIENQIRFLPDFFEAKGFYILDDWYFMLQFLAFNPKIRFSQLILYSYNNREKDIENDLRYLNQIALEHNAYRTIGIHLQQSKNVNLEFVGRALYSRAHMICKLLQPGPGRFSRVRLLKSLLLLLSQLEFNERPRYLLKTFTLLLRSL